ncbi:MAG: polysaccharide deacetylase [Rhizobiaceae bacterium]|nr:polysaccharide deacetylase [Rhizobiaceae bacterium]
MSVISRFAGLLSRSVGLLACFGTGTAAAAEQPRPHQVIIISFDGAHDLAQWQRSRTLAATTGARFSYFLSCVFLLSKQTRGLYSAPHMQPGRSNVGFAATAEEVRERLRQIWLARSEGHDIASHGCGHFDGSKWSKTDWLDEFASFRTILRNAWTLNGLAGEPAGWRAFAETEIEGFRAPYLATGKGLGPALSEAGFRYDASGISRGPAAPADAESRVVRFALPQIPVGPSGRRVIAMDYNLFVRDSGGFERGDAGGQFEARALAAFTSAFDEQYSGERVPLQIGFHFTLMNGGAYWRALERFARDVCVRADVDCISYADYVGRLKAEPEAAAPVGG